MPMRSLSFNKLIGCFAVVAFTGAASLATTPPTTSAIPIPTCPAKLSVTETADPIAGWTVDRESIATGRLQGIGFYDGPVAGGASLRPTGGRTRGKISTTIHAFDGHISPIYLACSYIGTDIVLSRQLPPGVKQCTITSDTMKPSAADDVVSCK